MTTILKKAIENFKTVVPFRELPQVKKHLLVEAGMTFGAIDRAIKGIPAGEIKKLQKSIPNPDQGIPALAIKARELLSLGKSLSQVCQELEVDAGVLRPWLNTWGV